VNILNNSYSALIAVTLLLHLLGACKPKTNAPPASGPPAYVGTYLGRDSIITYNQGAVVNTSIIKSSFVVAESKIVGKNAYFLSFQDVDSVQVNFLNGTFAIFSSTALPLKSGIGTFTSGSINYTLELQNDSAAKVYGTYYKL
jgi:hypothetical protein